jgi:actin related protein 2/3 complex subunit 4
MSKELILNPIKITRSKKEAVLIEPSVNSVRVSVKIKQMDELDTILCDKFTSFVMLRAEHFVVLRRKAVEGYNISFLVMSKHLDEMWRHKVVDFIIQFMTAIDAELSYLKLSTSARARIVAKEFFSEFADDSSKKD